jgi:NADH dehydrogenase
LTRPRIVIVGGGFAGLACARDLGAERFDVTLVDARSCFEFLPNIHELVSGVKDANSVRLPLAKVVEGMGHEFLRGTVTALNPDARTANVGKRRRLRAD